MKAFSSSVGEAGRCSEEVLGAPDPATGEHARVRRMKSTPLRSGNTSPQSSAQPGGKPFRHILYAEVTMRTLSYAVHLGLPVKFRVVRAAAAGGWERPSSPRLSHTGSQFSCNAAQPPSTSTSAWCGAWQPVGGPHGRFFEHCK